MQQLSKKNQSIIEQSDALSFLAKIPDASVDLVLTDPPFLPKSVAYQQIRFGKYAVQNVLDPIPTVDKEYLTEVFSECAKKLKPSGWLMFKSDDYTAREIYNGIENMEWMFTIVWDKMNIALGYYNRKQHEIIEVYRPKNAKDSYYKYKPPEKQKEVKWHGDLKEDKPKAVPSIIKVPKYNLGNLVYRNMPEKDIHINQTPVALWKIILDGYCPIDGNVLDPFCGTCSVYKAYSELGYKGIYYGCDIELNKYLKRGELENDQYISPSMRDSVI